MVLSGCTDYGGSAVWYNCRPDAETRMNLKPSLCRQEPVQLKRLALSERGVRIIDGYTDVQEYFRPKDTFIYLIPRCQK